MSRAILVCLAACGRLGFAPVDHDASAGGDGGEISDAPGPAPTAHASTSVVHFTGVSNLSYEADGTHMVFVDTTPGKNANLVVFRVGEGTTTLPVEVSANAGVSWNQFTIAPTNTSGINALGAMQDSVTHAFHLSWLDTSASDQYARLVPTYTNGDIDGFVVEANFGFFDDFADSPGPRDLAEIVDASGTHRLVFAGTANTGTTGRYKLAVTTSVAGLAPASQNDWAPATDQTMGGTDDALIANSYMTQDDPTTYLVAVSSNLAGGPGAPFVVLAGMPKDKDLFAWVIAPAGTANFAVGAMQTLSTSFGGGTGARADASLSLASGPAGDVRFAYGDAAGIHVGALDAGTITADALPIVTPDAGARHAVIASDTHGRPSVIYADDGGNITGTLLWGGAWLPAAKLDEENESDGVWAMASGWQVGGVDTFGMYRDDGASAATTFTQVYWQ